MLRSSNDSSGGSPEIPPVPSRAPRRSASRRGWRRAIAPVLLALVALWPPASRGPIVGSPPATPEPARPAPETPVAETPAAPEPRGPSLVARVTANGAPVADAVVTVADGSGPALATATSDRDGVARFELKPGVYDVFAREGDRVSPLAHLGELAARADVELALAPGGTIRGQVIGDGPLPRTATVALVPLDVDHAVRTATLDERGRFALAGMPRGRWRIAVDAASFATDEQDLELRERADVTLHVQRTGAISGVVVDAAGSPVANATIVVRSQSGARSRGGDLLRSLDGAPAFDPAGERHATIDPVAAVDRRPSEAPRRRWVHPLAGARVLPGREVLRFGAPRSGVRPAECGAGHCGVDIGWQRGTVIHAAADGTIALAYSDIRGEAGRYIAIDHGGGLRTLYMHLDEVRPGLEVGQRVRAGDAIAAMGDTGFAQGAHLHFAITQLSGGRNWYLDPEPILQHAVVLPAPHTLDPIDPTSRVVIAAAGERVATPTTIVTDARGRFRIAGIAPGAYTAAAFAAELAPGTSKGFAVAPGGETADVAITLAPGVLVLGRVVGRDGPIAGASVVATAGGGESIQELGRTYTSATGEYQLRALTGPVTLAVAATHHGESERQVVLDGAGRRREDFTLVAENAVLRGQVLAPDGGAAGVVTVRVVDGPTRRQVATDASGRFAIEHVATGTYTVEVAAPDAPPARATLQSDRWLDIRLERGGSAHCELRDASSGAPLAGIRVDASGPDGRTASATTDARGVANLRGLAVGAWTVRAASRGYGRVERVIAVRATTVPEDVRLELARGGAIAGVVRDRTGHRVAGAKISTDGATAVTDADGNFRLVDVAPGAHRVEAELDGASGAVDVQLAAGDERPTTIELGP